MKNINKISSFVLVVTFLITSLPNFAHAGLFNLRTNLKAEVGSTGRAETQPASQTTGKIACDAPIYARVNFTKDSSGARNWGTGNVARNVFVGGNAEANQYDDGEWFMMYDGKNYKVDPDLTNTYEDVPGLAVQRLEGGVRIVLHGDWDQPEGKPLTNRERVQGSLEFSNDKKTRSTSVIPFAQVSDSLHPMDYKFGHTTNSPQDDRMKLKDNLSQFKMVATTNNDGFYTNYRVELPADCK